MATAERLFQQDIAVHDDSLIQARTTAFRGKARVSFESLRFPDAAMIDLDRANVDRLRQIFEDEGCRRLEPERHIPALIRDADLQSALDDTASNGVTAGSLLENPHALPPLLKLPPNVFVECLRGKHRIAAAKETTGLDDTDRWWILDLYSADLSADVRRELIEEYSNSQNFTDGLIYLKILQYRASCQELAERQWWARLSKCKRDILKRFFRHTKLADGFAMLGSFKAVFVHGFKIGTLLKIMSTRLDEEILCYLDRINSVWSAIVGQDAECLQQIDSSTIEYLQLKAPGACPAEQRTLQLDSERGVVFGLVQGQSKRDVILRNLAHVQHPIPSLYTLRKDLKYLDVCGRAVRRMLFGSAAAQLKSSLCESARALFTGANQRQGYVRVEAQSSDLAYLQSTWAASQADIGYRQLHLYAMRHILDLSALPPKHSRKAPSQRRDENPFTWSAFAELAWQLGFDSTALRTLRQRSAERELAAVMLGCGYENPEPILGSITKLLQSAKRKAMHDDAPMDPSRDVVEDPSDRCGWITTIAYERTRHHLYLTKLSSCSQALGAGISALSVRKTVFESFFGRLDVNTSTVGEPKRTSCDDSPTEKDVRDPNKRRKLASTADDPLLDVSSAADDAFDANAGAGLGGVGPPDTLSEATSSARGGCTAPTHDIEMLNFSERQRSNQPSEAVNIRVLEGSDWKLVGRDRARSSAERQVSELLASDPDMHLYDATGRGTPMETWFDAILTVDRTVYVARRADAQRCGFPREEEL